MLNSRTSDHTQHSIAAVQDVQDGVREVHFSRSTERCLRTRRNKRINRLATKTHINTINTRFIQVSLNLTPTHYLKASFTIGSFMTTMPQIPKGRPTQQGVQQGITARISIIQTTDLDSSLIIFLQPKIKNI
jgi:hypothetical protein